MDRRDPILSRIQGTPSLSGLLAPCLVLLFGACADERTAPEQGLVVHPLPAPYGDIDLTYLPFEYLPDGCSQRASYLGMELVLRDVPTVAVDAETCDTGLGLHGPLGEPWRHHTVPAQIGDGEVLQLLDPLASTGSLTIAQWLAGMTDDPVRTFVTSIAYPTSHDHETDCGSVTRAIPALPRRVAELQPWLLENIMSDCAMLRQAHRDLEPADDHREQALLARTRTLVLRLEELGLLDTSFGLEPLEKMAQGPWCPEPVPK